MLPRSNYFALLSNNTLTSQTTQPPFTTHQPTHSLINIAERPRRSRKQLITRNPIHPLRRHNIQPLRIRRLPPRTIWIHPIRASYAPLAHNTKTQDQEKK